MTRYATNRLLQRAKKSKCDEFYTQLVDIDRELRYYRGYFKGKTVYCNCGDPRVSNFVSYFTSNFHTLGKQGTWLKRQGACFWNCPAVEWDET